MGICGNEILKITSAPDAHSRNCLSEGEDAKDTLLKARFDRLFEFRKEFYESKDGQRR